MKFSVLIALVGITAATSRHRNFESFIQTKFLSFAEDDKAPTADEIKQKEEREAKAAKIATATKEVEEDEEKDAMVSKKD